MITLLRSDQYRGLDSFRDVGAFVPFTLASDGTLIREVAAARFALSLPEHPGESLPVTVALVRDLRRREPLSDAKDAPPPRWDADLAWSESDWHDRDWQATPAPAPPTSAKLIPIVATAEVGDAATLARTYL